MWRQRFLLLLMSSVSLVAAGQDLHFSQFFHAPLLTNPANTGFIPDADYRIGVNYRNQWAAVTANPYRTFSAWGDAQVMRDKWENGWLGVGGHILRDVAGAGNLTSTKVYGSVAYHQMLGYSSLLSAGMNAGWSNKRVDLNRFTFDNQWNGKFFDAAIPSGEAFVNNRVNYFDVQVGMNYAYFPNERTYVNGGVSVMHVNRPKESFVDGSDAGNDARVAARSTVFLNGSFKVNDRWIVNPATYFTQQAKANQWVVGAHAFYNLSGDGAQQLLGGIYYRNAESFIPLVGFQWQDIRLTFTYDATVSTLQQFNNGRGAYEFSLIKSGMFSAYKGAARRQSMCPQF